MCDSSIGCRAAQTDPVAVAIRCFANRRGFAMSAKLAGASRPTASAVPSSGRKPQLSIKGSGYRAGSIAMPCLKHRHDLSVAKITISKGILEF